jgi:phosphatidylinositol glycan class S
MSTLAPGPVSSDKPLEAGSSRRATPAELTRKVNPSTTRRIVTTIAFPPLILLAVPYWWYVTSIVRLPLPIARIEALESSTVSLILPNTS